MKCWYKLHEFSLPLQWIELIVISKYQSSIVKYLNAFKQNICQTNYFDKRKTFFNIHWIIFQHRMFAINSPFSVWYYLEMLLPFTPSNVVTINQCCKRGHDLPFKRETSEFCVRSRLFYVLTIWLLFQPYSVTDLRHKHQ